MAGEWKDAGEGATIEALSAVTASAPLSRRRLIWISELDMSPTEFDMTSTVLDVFIASSTRAVV